MIGNDVVDLKLALTESNWRRPRYLPKIFTPEEIYLIQKSDNQDQMVWNLWTRKEAAYKIFNRMKGLRVFNPVQLAVEYISDGDGFVLINELQICTKTIFNSDYIYTIAVADSTLLKKTIQIGNDVPIYKNDGIPFIVSQNFKTQIPISITHHGRYEKRIGLLI